jgi:signal transduction histidine kinase
MLLGYVLAYFFVSLPLRKLRLAVEKLKAREVHDDLPPTGVREFDQLIEDFNGLAGELNRVESLRQNLISDTSHELKTPISALRVQLEGIKDGVVVLDKKRAEVLLNQVDRLSELTETLQEYARLRSKAATLKKKSVEIQSIIEAALEEQKTSLEIAKLEVEVLVTEGATILADKHLATQLVSNVIANACRHSQATKLTITANEKECSIVDNGKGVPEHSLKDLFERFYRVDGSRNRKEAGLGLGLAIVKEICHAHGWSCVAENADPGLEITITF